jgi:hypothetical protein
MWWVKRERKRVLWGEEKKKEEERKKKIKGKEKKGEEVRKNKLKLLVVIYINYIIIG